MKFTETEEWKEHLKELALDTSSDKDGDDNKDREETVAVLNVEAKQHSRILKVMPRNCNDQQFFSNNLTMIEKKQFTYCRLLRLMMIRSIVKFVPWNGKTDPSSCRLISFF